jgi:hypothetical protein
MPNFVIFVYSIDETANKRALQLEWRFLKAEGDLLELQIDFVDIYAIDHLCYLNVVIQN